MGQLGQIPFVIADGETESTAADVRSDEIVGFVIPPDYSEDDLAIVGRVAPRNESDRPTAALDFLNVVDSDGNALTIVAAADTYVVPTPALLCAMYGLSQMKLVAGGVQSGDQVIYAIVKPR